MNTIAGGAHVLCHLEGFDLWHMSADVPSFRSDMNLRFSIQSGCSATVAALHGRIFLVGE